MPPERINRLTAQAVKILKHKDTLAKSALEPVNSMLQRGNDEAARETRTVFKQFFDFVDTSSLPNAIKLQEGEDLGRWFYGSQKFYLPASDRLYHIDTIDTLIVRGQARLIEPEHYKFINPENLEFVGFDEIEDYLTLGALGENPTEIRDYKDCIIEYTSLQPGAALDPESMGDILYILEGKNLVSSDEDRVVLRRALEEFQVIGAKHGSTVREALGLFIDRLQDSPSIHKTNGFVVIEEIFEEVHDPLVWFIPSEVRLVEAEVSDDGGPHMETAKDLNLGSWAFYGNEIFRTLIRRI